MNVVHSPNATRSACTLPVAAPYGLSSSENSSPRAPNPWHDQRAMPPHCRTAPLPNAAANSIGAYANVPVAHRPKVHTMLELVPERDIRRVRSPDWRRVGARDLKPKQRRHAQPATNPVARAGPSVLPDTHGEAPAQDEDSDDEENDGDGDRDGGEEEDPEEEEERQLQANRERTKSLFRTFSSRRIVLSNNDATEEDDWNDQDDTQAHVNDQQPDEEEEEEEQVELRMEMPSTYGFQPSRIDDYARTESTAQLVGHTSVTRSFFRAYSTAADTSVAPAGNEAGSADGPEPHEKERDEEEAEEGGLPYLASRRSNSPVDVTNISAFAFSRRAGESGRMPFASFKLRLQDAGDASAPAPPPEDSRPRARETGQRGASPGSRRDSAKVRGRRAQGNGASTNGYSLDGLHAAFAAMKVSAPDEAPPTETAAPLSGFAQPAPNEAAPETRVNVAQEVALDNNSVSTLEEFEAFSAYDWYGDSSNDTFNGASHRGPPMAYGGAGGGGAVAPHSGHARQRPEPAVKMDALPRGARGAPLINRPPYADRAYRPTPLAPPMPNRHQATQRRLSSSTPHAVPVPQAPRSPAVAAPSAAVELDRSAASSANVSTAPDPSRGSQRSDSPSFDWGFADEALYATSSGRGSVAPQSSAVPMLSSSEYQAPKKSRKSSTKSGPFTLPWSSSFSMSSATNQMLSALQEGTARVSRGGHSHGSRSRGHSSRKHRKRKAITAGPSSAPSSATSSPRRGRDKRASSISTLPAMPTGR